MFEKRTNDANKREHSIKEEIENYDLANYQFVSPKNKSMAQSDAIEDEVGEVFLEEEHVKKKSSPKPKEQLQIKIPTLRPQYVSPIPDMKSTMKDNNYTQNA